MVEDETEILKEILRKIEAIKLGLADPKELEKVAVDTIVKFSLANLSDGFSDILHDCVDFAENPAMLDDIERKVKDVLS